MEAERHCIAALAENLNKVRWTHGTAIQVEDSLPSHGQIDENTHFTCSTSYRSIMKAISVRLTHVDHRLVWSDDVFNESVCTIIRLILLIKSGPGQGLFHFMNEFSCKYRNFKNWGNYLLAWCSYKLQILNRETSNQGPVEYVTIIIIINIFIQINECDKLCILFSWLLSFDCKFWSIFFLNGWRQQTQDRILIIKLREFYWLFIFDTN